MENITHITKTENTLAETLSLLRQKYSVTTNITLMVFSHKVSNREDITYSFSTIPAIPHLISNEKNNSHEAECFHSIFHSYPEMKTFLNTLLTKE